MQLTAMFPANDRVTFMRFQRFAEPRRDSFSHGPHTSPRPRREVTLTHITKPAGSGRTREDPARQAKGP